MNALPLDVTTLLVVNSVNLLSIACTMWLIIGREVSPAVINAQVSLFVQALGWMVIIASGFWRDEWADWVLSTLSVGLTSLGQWLMFLALRGWLGPRPRLGWMRLLVLVTPIAYAFSFSSYPARVGIANGLLALQLLLLALATLAPTTQLGGRWRWVIFACAITMSMFTLARGVMGAFFTDSYPNFAAPHPVNVLAMLAANVALVLGGLAVMAAWREEADVQLRRQPYTDGLTGLVNRYGWEVQARTLFGQATRHNLPLTLMTFQLDGFSDINHHHSHATGDRVLKLLAGLLTENEGSIDLAARTRGDEFSVLLLQTDITTSVQFYERLSQTFKQACQQQLDLCATFSAGLAALAPTDATLAQLQVRADRALQVARRGHADQLEVATGSGELR